MSADDPTVEASDVAPNDLARAKAAINDFRARYQRGEISPAQMNRVFAGAPRRRDDPDAVGVLFVDELSSTARPATPTYEYTGPVDEDFTLAAKPDGDPPGVRNALGPSGIGK